jgi:predicted nucleic acid-binding protein
VIVVDASVWVSRLIPQDIFHDFSRSWLQYCLSNGEDLVAPILLAMEVAGAVSRRTGDADLAKRTLRQMMSSGIVRFLPIDHRLGQSAADLASDLGLRGADAAYVAAAYLLGIPLVTWDREQRLRSHGVVIALTPEEASNQRP